MDLNNEINGRVYAPYIIEGRWYLKGINIGSSRCQTSSSNSQQDAKIAALEEAIKKLTDVYVSGGEWVIEDQGEYILLKYTDNREPIKIAKPIKDVTLTINKEDIFNVEGAGKYRPGTQVPLVAHVLEGYDFVGFFDGENLISNNPNHTYTIQKDVVIEARYTRKMGTLRIELGEGVEVSKIIIGEQEYTSRFETEYTAPIGTPYTVEIRAKKGYIYSTPHKTGSIVSGTTTVQASYSDVIVPNVIYKADGDEVGGSIFNDDPNWNFLPTSNPDVNGWDNRGKTFTYDIQLASWRKLLPSTSFTFTGGNLTQDRDWRNYTITIKVPDPTIDDIVDKEISYRSQELTYVDVKGIIEGVMDEVLTSSVSKYKVRSIFRIYFEDTINVKIPAKPDMITEYNIGGGWKKYGSGVTINSTTTLEVRYVETPKFKVLAYEVPSEDILSAGNRLDEWLPTKEKLSNAHVVSEYVILPTDIGQRKEFDIPHSDRFENQRILYAVPSGYQISAIYDKSNNRIEFREKKVNEDAPYDISRGNWQYWRLINEADILPPGYGEMVASKEVIIKSGVAIDDNYVVIIEKVS